LESATERDELCTRIAIIDERKILLEAEPLCAVNDPVAGSGVA
jgi:hypothetical protein